MQLARPGRPPTMADVDVWQAARQGLLEDVQVSLSGVFSAVCLYPRRVRLSLGQPSTEAERGREP